MEALHANTMLTTYARYISFQRSGETISHSRDIFYIFYKIIKISTIYIYSDILYHSDWTQKLKALNIKVRSTVSIITLILEQRNGQLIQRIAQLILNVSNYYI